MVNFTHNHIVLFTTSVFRIRENATHTHATSPFCSSICCTDILILYIIHNTAAVCVHRRTRIMTLFHVQFYFSFFLFYYFVLQQWCSSFTTSCSLFHFVCVLFSFLPCSCVCLLEMAHLYYYCNSFVTPFIHCVCGLC